MSQRSKAFKDAFVVGQGYVFYDRLKDSATRDKNVWNSIYKSAMTEYSGAVKVFSNTNYSNVGETIIAQGKVEQEKERKFLQKIYGVDTKEIGLGEYPEFINNINKLIGLKDDYKKLLALIDQGRYDKKGNKKAEKAYTSTAYFDSYLNTELTAGLNRFFQNKSQDEILNMSPNDFLNASKKIVSNAIDRTIKKISQQKDYINNEEVMIWTEMVKILNISDTYLTQFKSDIYKRFNLDDALKDILAWKKGNSTKNNRGLSSQLSKNIKKTGKGSASINGYIEEYLAAAMSQINSNGSGKNIKSAVMSGNVMKTDSVTICSLDTGLDAEQLAQELNSTSKKSSSLIEANKLIENFYNDYLKNLDDTFIIYESTKAYSFGENFRGFHTGSNSLNKLPSLLDEIGIKVDGQTFIEAIYNSIPNAILNGTIDLEKISLTISRHMANFLFDDWRSIGTSNNAIHMFTLDSIKVPLSYLLIATGEAIKKIQKEQSLGNGANSLFRFSIYNLPNDILYKEKMKDVSSIEEMEEKWNIQKETVAKATYSISFLRNFKDIVKDLLNKVK